MLKTCMLWGFKILDNIYPNFESSIWESQEFWPFNATFTNIHWLNYNRIIMNSSQVMKDEHSYMNENTQNSPKIVVTKYNFLHLKKLDKMSTPNLMTILWTLGRLDKFGTWLNQFSNKKKMKILYVVSIFGPN
jgi:hypothetical protein